MPLAWARSPRRTRVATPDLMLTATCQNCREKFSFKTFPPTHVCQRRTAMAVESAPIPAAWKPGEKAEADMGAAMFAAGIEGWVKQEFWCEGRKYKADFVFKKERVLVEVIGAAHLAGRDKLEADCERYAIAASRGWLVVHVTAKSIRKGTAVEWVEKALQTRRAT